MVIVTKTVKTIEEVNAIFDNSCTPVWNVMKPILEDNNFRSYDDWAKWAAETLNANVPSPFGFDYPNCYNLTILNSCFTISIPNSFGVGIAVDGTGKNLKYRVDILFYKNPGIVEQSPYYKELMDNGWTRKLKEDKPKFKNKKTTTAETSDSEN